jgi:hypothetical protein
MRTLKAFCVLVVVFSVVNSGSAVIAFSGAGSGTQQNPYRISDVYQLQEMNNNLSAYYKLVNDIDASFTINWNNGAGFVPIGGNGQAFTGTFDGQSYKITDLYLNSSLNAGFFGQTDFAVIENVGLVNTSVNGQGYAVGGLVGANFRGRIINTYVTGTITNSDVTGAIPEIQHTGGLVGMNYQGSISNSYSMVHISVTPNVEDTGGLVGLNWSGSITDSHATGNVNGSRYVGGLVGRNLGGSLLEVGRNLGVPLLEGGIGIIASSYATGDVTNSATGGGTGGLVGENDGGIIQNVYSTGNVSGWIDVGGLVGNNSLGYIANSYTTGDVNGNDGVDIGGLVGFSVAGSITDSYATGKVSKGVKDYIGGLVGYIQDGVRTTINSSYWDVNTSGQSASAGGAGRTTAQMKQKATFIGWDFAHSWRINEGVDYPRFINIWQQPPILSASIDIRPGSQLNLLNVEDDGVLPVVIEGTLEDVNVLEIDLASIRLHGVAPVSCRYEYLYSIRPNRAPISNLVLQFDVQDLVAVLGTDKDGKVIELTLTGELNDGTNIQGKDSILVISRVK